MVCFRTSIGHNRLTVEGYGTFFPSTTDYDIGNSPKSWALIPALRHAMTKYPYTTYFFALSPHALIMNPSLPIESHVMEKKRLESLMLKDKPVVPPDSVIKTFSFLKGDKIDLVLTQDGEGLCQGSFILRRGTWARFFLDTWFDPLYRSYNFQKAEGHALVSYCDDAFNRLEDIVDRNPGTCRAMASDHPNQTCAGSAKYP